MYKKFFPDGWKSISGAGVTVTASPAFDWSVPEVSSPVLLVLWGPDGFVLVARQLQAFAG